MDEREKKCLSDIEQYGCHIVHVMEENDLPPFSYSVGIQQTTGALEVAVIGLKRELSHFMINEYLRRVKEGRQIEPGSFQEDFIEGFPIYIGEVLSGYYEEYFGWNIWFYGEKNFQMIQLVYPMKESVWPWDEHAPKAFVKWQPLLTTE